MKAVYLSVILKMKYVRFKYRINVKHLLVMFLIEITKVDESY